MKEQTAAYLGLSARNLSRVVSIGLAAGTGTVLGLALWLEPSALGHSTHTQLGLGSCTFLSLSGYPCPMCGMTTTFALMAHLRPIAALMNQPFGVALFLITASVFGISLAEAILPRDRWSRLLHRLAPWETSLATLFLVGMALGWVYKIAVMRWLV